MEAASAFHAEAMAAIHADAFALGARWSAAAIGLQLSAPGAFGWLAHDGGFVLARVAADEAEILTLAVMAQARRSGLGRHLLTRAMTTAAARGAGHMLLEVGAQNVAALALYEAAGFAVVGRRARYYDGGEDAWILRANLSSVFADDEGG